MEDAHAFIYDYCGVPGQGYFAVFECVGLLAWSCCARARARHLDRAKG